MIVSIDENKPHKVSEVICVRCHKRWIAVRHVGTRLMDLECPNCGVGGIIETGEDLYREEEMYNNKTNRL